MKNLQNNTLIYAGIWSLAIVVTALILGNAFKNRNVHEDTIKVVGLGTVDFTSDEISWAGSFSTHAMDSKDAYNKLLSDKEKVRQFFLGKGFKADEFTFGGIRLEKLFRSVVIERNGDVRTEQVFDGYEAYQDVSFRGKKNPDLMARIEKVSSETSELINSGIEFYGQQIQYTYSDLPSLKHDLIENATKDARERAQKIVKNGKGSLGKLKDASMGVFQITGKGSNEEDSYGGNFDVYNKEKTARITVRLTYNLD